MSPGTAPDGQAQQYHTHAPSLRSSKAPATPGGRASSFTGHESSIRPYRSGPPCLCCPADLTALVLALHTKAVYSMRVGTRSGSLQTSNGIRHGCTLAPALWTFLSCYIFRKLSTVLDGVPHTFRRRHSRFLDNKLSCAASGLA